MNLKQLALGFQSLDPEKDPKGYLEHYIRQNWKAGSDRLSLAELETQNFDEKFVRDLFKKEPPPEKEEDKIPEPSEEEITAMQEKLAKERKSEVTREDAKIHIVFERISEKHKSQGFDLSHFHEREDIFPGQDTMSRIFYHPDKKGQESAPTFKMDILRNITTATQKMVEAALQEDFIVSLHIAAEHYDHVADRSGRIGASPHYVGDKYEAKGNIYISS